ncbi:MAG: hypothetical protein II265_04095, partial [Clostridia bacterium]|nr:hypothetical protein [Clostridia bacterium]
KTTILIGIILNVKKSPLQVWCDQTGLLLIISLERVMLKMASEMINKVLEAEKKAAEREADAKAKAADIIKTAEAEAKAATDAEKKAALEEGDRVVAEAKLQAEAIYSKARAEVQGQIENLKQLGNDRRDVSAEAVLKTIIPQD